MPDTDLEVTAPRRRRWVARMLVVCALVGVALVVALSIRGGHAKQAVAVVAAQRDDVKVSVAGVGTLQSTTSAALSFSAGGRVSAVSVVAGQRVRRGQVLATLDGTVAESQLRTARADVASNRAALAQLIAGRSPQERRQSSAQIDSAASALADANVSLRKAHSVARADRAGLRTALTQAIKTRRASTTKVRDDERKLGGALAQVSTLQRKAQVAKAAVTAARARQVTAAATRRDLSKRQLDETNTRTTVESAMTDAKSDLTDARTAAASARTAANDACRTDPSAADCTAARDAAAAAQSTADAAQARVAALQARADQAVRTTTDTQKSLLDSDFSDTDLARQLELAQSDLTDAQSALERARGRRDTLRSSLPADRDAQRTAAAAVATAAGALRSGRATSDQTLSTARQSAHSATEALRLARATANVDNQPARPAALGAARAALATANSSLTSAREGVADTVLRAPVDGVVAQVGLSVGDVVSGGNANTTASARSGQGGDQSSGGGSAAGGGPAGGGGSAGGGSSGAGGTSGGTITVTSAKLSIFTAPLTQADAVAVRAGDKAELLLHSVRRTISGRVVRVSPVATTTNGVVTYAVTIAAPRVPKQMRPGMTADVTIVTAERRGVVTLPSSAIPAAGAVAQVQVQARGRTVTRSLRLGLRGDDATEVLSGLRPGERVVVPQPSDQGGDDGGGDFGGDAGGGDFGGQGGGP